MLVKMAPPSPGASISLARSQPDEKGCVMIHVADLNTARSHGWEIAAEEAEAPPDGTDLAADGTDAADATPVAPARKPGRIKI